MADDLLQTYLQNHWVASTAGLALFERVAGSAQHFPEAGGELQQLTGEVAEDREQLKSIMRRVGVEPSTVGTALGRAAELVGRLKPNGSIVSRSPLTDLIELEGLRVAVSGKKAGWHVLLNVAEQDPRLERAELEQLLARAESQLDRLEKLHVEVGVARLSQH